MIRRPPRSTLDRSSAASDVYKRQVLVLVAYGDRRPIVQEVEPRAFEREPIRGHVLERHAVAVSYTHLRAHETVLDLVCRLLLEKKKKTVDKVVDCIEKRWKRHGQQGADKRDEQITL